MDSFSLNKKTALVTGASRGIGRACARTLSEQGFRVAICARGQAGLDKVIAEMGGAQAGHFAVACDLIQDDAPSELADRVSSAFGTLDAIVHNFGGTLGVHDPHAPISEWRRVWRANVEVAIELNASLLPPMLERGTGRVVFISSGAAIEHQSALPYSISKAAMTAYARSMGRTIAASGVVMSAVIPGIVLTEGGSWERAQREDPERVTRMLEELPRGRFGTPEEVADFVAFLCSDKASAASGGLFQIDGGQGRSFFG
jgi:3-oxoacyl-[acyl-carrier protein] reductase